MFTVTENILISRAGGEPLYTFSSKMTSPGCQYVYLYVYNNNNSLLKHEADFAYSRMTM